MNEGQTANFDQAIAAYIQAATVFVGMFRELREGGFERSEAFALVRQFADLYWRGIFFKEVGWPGENC
jgi:hypothetical protein